MPLTLAGWRRRKRREVAEQALRRVELADRMEHRPNQLSGGQLQRVAIARSIVMSPRLVLADEPTGNLDSRSSLEIIRLLESLNEDGLTLIVVTHDPELGGRAQRRLTMLDGRIGGDERV